MTDCTCYMKGVTTQHGRTEARVLDPRCPEHGKPAAMPERKPCQVIVLTPEHFAAAQHSRDCEARALAAGYTF